MPSTVTKGKQCWVSNSRIEFPITDESFRSEEIRVLVYFRIMQARPRQTFSMWGII